MRVEEALRESEERSRLILEAALDAAITIDAGGAITAWNRQAQAIFGWSAEEVLGASLAETIIPHSHREAHRRGLERFLATGEGPLLNRRIEITALDRTGREFPVEISISPVWAGGAVFFSGFVRDISERKRLEEERSRLYAELEREAAELERRVAERTVELEAANRELEAFTYSVSHDLRAPLRAMDGYARSLLENYAPELSPDARHRLEVVRERTRHMAQLVDGLLALSRLGRQPLARRPVEVAPLVREALAEVGEEAGRRVEISLGELSSAEADWQLLRQVFVNLLSNALKYTRSREVARITVGSYREGNERVWFVRDNGVGFKARYADKLFTVFQRLHRPEEYEGVGVGLALVRRIVERHGGRVWAEGEEGQGATFSFTLGEGSP